MRSLSVPLVSWRRPLATTVTAVTSITPIISALAVTAVRPGWRIALRRASRPAEPPIDGRRAADQRRRARAPRATAAAACGPTDRRRAGPRPERSSSPAAPAGMPATSVTSVPTSRPTIAVRASNTMPACGQREVERSEHRVDPGARAEARADADDRRADAERERLEHHRAEHLPARGADHAQHRELARALGDRDRERVEDRERAHEDRHAAEDQQHDLDDPDELLQAVEREAVLRLRRTGPGCAGPTAAATARRTSGALVPWRPATSTSRSGPACGTAAAPP